MTMSQFKLFIMQIYIYYAVSIALTIVYNIREIARLSYVPYNYYVDCTCMLFLRVAGCCGIILSWIGGFDNREVYFDIFLDR